MNYPNLFQIITDIKFEEIKTLQLNHPDWKTSADQAVRDQIAGIKIMAKALREKLENE